MKELRQDIERRFEKFSDKPLFWRWYYYLGKIQYRTLVYYRLSKGPFGWFFSQLYKGVSLKSGLEINTERLGGGVIVPHWGRILINAKTVGDNLYVFHNVTIGHDYSTGKPTIGNNVIIGTGATIIGDIVIGDNVIIGSNSLVNSDIPNDSVVAGNPARPIRKTSRDSMKDLLGY